MFTEPTHRHIAVVSDPVIGWKVSTRNAPMVEVLFKLVQEVPSFLHLWVPIRVVRRSYALCR